jgi:peptidoglycan/xylan/chitin deacetylase (PgdA/CDA1 family)
MPGDQTATNASYKSASEQVAAAARSPAWRPTPLISISVAVHGAAGAVAVVAPALWPWALGAVVANHAVLATAGLLPRASLLGPNLVRLPPPAAAQRKIALTFDDGPDPEATPRVLDLLDAAGVRASFFCIGRRARQHPGLVREIVARGHRVENHGDAHKKTFAAYGLGRLRADIGGAQATLADLTGQWPRFFRPLGGIRTPLLEPVLTRLDLRLASWTRRGFDSVQGDPERVFGRLVRGLSAGDILLLHDGDAARTREGKPVALAVLPRLLTTIRGEGLQPVTLAEAVP